MGKLEKKWEIAVAFIFLSIGLSAQVSLRYLPCVTCNPGTTAQSYKLLNTTDDINSDFGKRNAPGASSWHKGIDLNISGVNDLGYHILSPVNATITRLDRVNTYVILVIDGPGNQDFGFGHIFTDDFLPIQLGDLVLTQCSNPNLLAIINLTSGIAIGPVNGSMCTYNGNNYIVTNQVQQGQVIAPVGNSGYAAPHLHLYHPANPMLDPQSTSNAKDPLEVLAHFNTAYSIYILNTNNLTTNTVNTYYSGSVAASVAVHCEMMSPGILGSSPDQYYHSAVMDIDKIELFIRREGDATEPYTAWGGNGSAYKMIQGLDYLSYLSNGSRSSSSIYPLSLTQATTGSYNYSGIAPFAYNNQPYDQYYFSDILTRIHTDHIPGQLPLYANIIEDARYKDGNYSLFIRVSRVNGVQFSSDYSAINVLKIDNFRPYIRKVSIRKELSTVPFFAAEWNWTGSNLIYSNSMNGCVAGGNNVVARIYTSEPMKDVIMKIGSWQTTVNIACTGSNAMEWEIPVPFSVLQLGQNQLHISGHDLANNPLEGFLTTSPKLSGTFPVRESSYSWYPYPQGHYDIVHYIKVEDDSPPTASFTPVSVVINQHEYVSFTDLSSGGTITDRSWSFTGGSPSASVSQNPVIQYNTLGTFPVSLLVSNAYGSSTALGTVTVTSDLLVPVADFSPKNVSISINTTVHFLDLSTGNPDQWYWDFDGAAPASVLQNPYVTFDQAGVYTIGLAVINTAGFGFASGTITVSDQPAALDVICMINPFMASPGTLLNFQASVFNGTPPYLYVFDFGDGCQVPVSSSSFSASASHSYTTAGNYNLTVTVTDAYGQLSACPEMVSILGGDPCDGFSVDFTHNPGGSVFSVPANSPVVFSDLTTGGTMPYLYVWTFHPDPVTGAQPSLTTAITKGPHTVIFPQAGNYIVSLHVYDDQACAKTLSRNITVFDPNHCLVAKINKIINGKMIVSLGTYDFWDFTFVPWCGACEDPPGSSNFPCETNNRWRLVKLPNNTLLSFKQGFPFHDPGCTLSNSFDQLFQYDFTQEGWYKLILQVWDMDCNVLYGFDCQDITSLLIRVIDCEKNITVCNSNISIQAGPNDDLYARTIIAGGPSCPLIVPAGASIEFLATREIQLLDGFEARNDAVFRAAIIPCPGESPNSVNLLKNATEKTGSPGIELYPNPVTDFLSFRIYSEQKTPYSLFLFNLLGECLWKGRDLSGTDQTIDCSIYPPGLYVFKYEGELGTLSFKLIRNK